MIMEKPSDWIDTLTGLGSAMNNSILERIETTEEIIQIQGKVARMFFPSLVVIVRAANRMIKELDQKKTPRLILDGEQDCRVFLEILKNFVDSVPMISNLADKIDGA